MSKFSRSLKSSSVNKVFPNSGPKTCGKTKKISGWSQTSQDLWMQDKACACIRRVHSLSVCLSLSACLSLSVCLAVSVCPSVHLHVCLYVCPFVLSHGWFSDFLGRLMIYLQSAQKMEIAARGSPHSLNCNGFTWKSSSLSNGNQTANEPMIKTWKHQVAKSTRYGLLIL